MNAWRRTAAGFLLIAGLAACAGGAPPPETGSGTKPAPASDVAATLPPPPNANTLLNRGSAEIVDILGKPGFVRRDPPAELWRYRTEVCTLDLYFYEEDVGGNYSLSWLDFRNTASTAAARNACLRDILRQSANRENSDRAG